jgi:hypothetical protein
MEYINSLKWIKKNFLNMRASGLTESKNIIQCQLMDNKLLVHKHLIVRAEVYRPPMDEEFLRRWLNEFISEIGMKVMMGPLRSIL